MLKRLHDFGMNMGKPSIEKICIISSAHFSNYGLDRKLRVTFKRQVKNRQQQGNHGCADAEG